MLAPSTSVVARSAQSRDPTFLTGSLPAPISGAQPEGAWRAHHKHMVQVLVWNIEYFHRLIFGHISGCLNSHFISSAQWSPVSRYADIMLG
jgi:hypothetical protein